MLNLKQFKETTEQMTLTKAGQIYSAYEDIIGELVKAFLEIKNTDGTVYFVGNGGSAAISMHMTIDFFKNGQMRTHGMHDPAVITCFGNDYGYEYIFSKQLEMTARPNDLLVAISSSGESPNILNAVDVARKKNLKIITLSGFRPNNTLSKSGDINVYVPNMQYGIVESIHNLILQDVVDEIKNINERK